MRYHEITALDEGVHDPHIFKAVFMAGGPGSGKSTVGRLLFSATGLRLIDLDRFEALARSHGATIDYNDPRSYEPFWRLAQQQKRNYLAGRLGLLIDGTGKSFDSIRIQKEMLQQLGYDTAMIFVNTNLETAQQRVIDRARTQGRLVPPERVSHSWYAAQNNLGQFQSEFAPNFFIVDNSGAQPEIESAEKWIRRFLTTPPRSPAARAWIQQQERPTHESQ